MAKQSPDRQVEWHWSLHVNTQEGWRERLGYALRRLARRIDGRTCLALRVEAQPPINAQQWVEVQLQGIGQIKRSLGAVVIMEAQEQLLRELHPDLYEVGQSG